MTGQYERNRAGAMGRSPQPPSPIAGQGWESLTRLGEEKKQVNQLAAIVKVKHVPVLNPNLMKPGDVMKKVQQRLDDPKITRGGRQVARFTTGFHSMCWKRYKVRPPAGSPNPYETDSRYCVYDPMHQDYGYTEMWVDFLVEKLKDETEVASLYKVIPLAPAPIP